MNEILFMHPNTWRFRNLFIEKKPHKIVGMFIGEEMRKAGFEMLWEKNRQEYAPQCKQICAMVPEGCSLLLQWDGESNVEQQA